MSIKKKLVFIMLLISFVPLILLSVISIRYLSRSLEEETINQCQQQVDEINLQINGYIDKPFMALKAIAANPTVKAFDLPQIKAFLVEVQKTYSDSSFSLDDAQGNQVVRGDDIPLVNIKERAFFKSALSGKDEAISEVTFSKNSNRFVVNLATPVRNEAGTVIGVMQGSITLTKISEFVTNLSTNGNIAYVVDSEGKILAHPDATQVKERVNMSDVSFVKQGLAEKKNGFSVIEDKAGGKKLVTYDYDARTGWLICLEVPYDVITAKINSLSLTLGIVTLVVLGLVGLLVFFIAKRFSEPILRIQKLANQVAQGDLTRTVKISSSDEIGLLAKSFDTMVNNLKQVIGRVHGSSQQLAASSEELSANAEQSASAANQVALSITEVAHGADKQQHLASETTAVIEEMAESIRNVAVNANEVSEQSNRAAATAKAGGKSAESAVKKMIELENIVSNSAQVVAKLGERSKEIGQIIDTISGIAGQTNLLALNAAIEAARAGEQGRGFAVVAEEVRKLAEQSQDAAKQIADLIGEIQTETDKAVLAMEEGSREVKSGTGVVTEAGEAFAIITDLVTNLADQVGKISATIQQLAGNSNQIVASVQQINQLTKMAVDETQTVSAATEEQSASMEEIASASQSLAQMAQDLQDAVRNFRI